MLKRTVGFEAEFFIIDSEGNIQPKADIILSESKGTRYPLMKEYAKEVVETATLPFSVSEATVLDFLNSFYAIDEVALKHDLYLLPMAVYPGEYEPATRTDTYYRIKEDIFGKENFKKAARVTSFHFHHNLPQEKEGVLNIYNFMVAASPVFSVLSQSSPFYNGKFLAKSVREVIYRDFEIRGIKGCYYEYPIFGGISPYFKSFKELEEMIKRRKETWERLVKEKGYSTIQTKLFDFNWGTVRLNRFGTVELRVPDMTLPSVLVELIKLFKDSVNVLFDENLRITISDVKTIRKEGDKLLVPSYRRLRDIYIRGALYGLQDREVFEYISSFLKLTNAKLKRINSMLENKRTVSDAVITIARKRGWDGESALTNELAKEIALHMAKLLLDEAKEVEEKAKRLLSEIDIIYAYNDSLFLELLKDISKERAIDIARGSPSRLKNISIVVIPYEAIKKNDLKEVKKLSKKYRIIVVGKKLKDIESIALPSTSCEEKEKYIKALLSLLASKENKTIKEIGYIGFSECDKNLVKFFGAGFALPSSHQSVKKNAEVMLTSITDLETFLSNPDI